MQLANDSGFQSARKGLAPSGKITPRKLVFVVQICTFELFEKLSGGVLHMQGTHNRLLQWLRLGIVKNGREKTNRRKKLNISVNQTPLKASDRNVVCKAKRPIHPNFSTQFLK